MVSSEYFQPSRANSLEQPVGRLILAPNNSMSWRAARYFLISLVAVSLTTATVFAYRGYWVVLPFSVVELLCLGACFYYLIRRNQTLQVITFAATKISIEIGRKKPEQRYDWQRFFTKVFVESPKQRGRPKAVFLKCKEESREIGEFLNSSDKEKLVRQLRLMISAADERQKQISP